jgi:hypothetical protein
MKHDLMKDIQASTLGFNVYCWGEQYQDALLADCILPLFSRLKTGCDVQRLWYDRATLRGPHIFGLATVPACRHVEIMELIHTQLMRSIDEQPSRQRLTAGELNVLHLDAGGKALCDADLEDGMAANNTFRVFVHTGPDARYPFSLWKDNELFWRISAQLAMFTLRQVAARKPAVQKISVALVALLAFDKVFFERSKEATKYWTYHISTLIPNLDVKRLAPSHIRAVLGHTISPKDFARISEWRCGRMEGGLADQSCDLEECFRELQSVVGELVGKARTAARELLHVLLKQLGVSTMRQIPLIFSLLAMKMDVQAPGGDKWRR